MSEFPYPKEAKYRATHPLNLVHGDLFGPMPTQSEQGIVHQLTVPYSPKQNEVLERKNRPLTEITRCLLSEANLPQRFWAEEAMTATYLQNRFPTKPNKKTPYEFWTNLKPDLFHIRVFGFKAYAYIQKQKRGKLDDKAVEGIFLDKEPILTAFCDPDWANDKSDRKSISGNVLKLGNSTIQWISTSQNCVALSSTEAEYVSTDNAAQEVIWLINLTKDLDLPQPLPVTIYEGNQFCIKLSESPKHHSRTKHIDVKYHNLRHLEEAGTIELVYCQSKNMTTDILTKPLPRPAFEFHRKNLQLMTVYFSKNV
ncbi:Copia protein [Araneus ventricosus]|uniref:Copia protein n=1 Tax=Araneus ventricosus TaxID=182803 RepID=A0A4Y2D4E8_ARAVE|nr:Copia protein [Araneus ventricosus]